MTRFILPLIVISIGLAFAAHQHVLGSINIMSSLLFGGSKGWNASQWVSVDDGFVFVNDRVRGGSSISYLEIIPASV